MFVHHGTSPLYPDYIPYPAEMLSCFTKAWQAEAMYLNLSFTGGTLFIFGNLYGQMMMIHPWIILRHPILGLFVFSKFLANRGFQTWAYGIQ